MNRALLFRIGSVCMLATLGVGCVDAAGEDELGSTNFNKGGVFSSPTDFAPAGPASGAEPAEPLPPSAAGVAAPAPLAGQTGGGVAGVPAVPVAGGVPTGAAGAGGSTGMAGRGAAGAAPAGRGGAAGSSSGAAGMPAAGAPAAGGDAVAPSGTGMLTVNFTSVAVGGRYAPRNCGAVWIETSSGMFVKTLERWAGIRTVHLSRWTRASGGWGSTFGGGGNTADRMDAVSRATLRSHAMHSLMWNMQDAAGKVVPDGKYRVMIEVADDNIAQSGLAMGEFDKGAMPATVMVPNKAPASGFTISFQP